MLSIKVTTGRRELAKYARRFRRAIDLALEDTARAIPGILAEQYRQGLGPDGKANRPNDPDTAATKAEDLGHTTPLRGRGQVLTDAARYQVDKQADGNWHVLPPEEREQAIRALRARGYAVHEMPPRAQDVLAKAIADRLGIQ